MAEAIERHQKLDQLSTTAATTATPLTTATTTTTQQQRRKLASEQSLVDAKKLRLEPDVESVVDETDEESQEVENIISGKVLFEDFSGIPEFEELMSTESKSQVLYGPRDPVLGLSDPVG